MMIKHIQNNKISCGDEISCCGKSSENDKISCRGKLSQVSRIVSRAGVVLLTVCLLAGCGLKSNTTEEMEYRQLGLNAMAIGDYEEAIDDFKSALDESLGGIGSLEVDICLYEAEALYLNGQSDEALDLYNSLIDYHKYVDVYYLRGNLYFAEGEYDLGIADFDAALAKADKDYELYIAIFNTMAKYGKGEAGRAYLEKALEIKGTKPKDYMEKGRIYYLLEDMEEAEKYLQQALDGGYEEANFYMAQVCMEKEDNTSAENYFQAYIESDAADAERLMKEGENSMDTGDYSSALTYFKAALDMNEESIQQKLMRDTIIAYEYNGDFSSAKSLMESYVELYPDDYDAEDEMTFLETR